MPAPKLYEGATSLGILLQDIRWRNGDSRKTMAKKLYMSDAYLSFVIYGKRPPPSWLYERINSSYDLDEETKNRLQEEIAISSNNARLSMSGLSQQERINLVNTIKKMGGTLS